MAAVQSATQEKQDYSKALTSLKSGSSVKVRVPSMEDVVEVYIHSVYKAFYSTPCTKGMGKEDYYDKAVSLLYADADKAEEAGNKEKAQELKDTAYQLKAKARYLFGFFSLTEGGVPIILDLSKKQAQSIFAVLNKYEKKIGSLAFEISKNGSGTSTQISVTPIIDEDDLSDKEKKAFAETAGTAFPEEIYSNVLKVKTEEEQLEDLRTFGFDVSRLGVGSAPVADSDAEVEF